MSDEAAHIVEGETTTRRVETKHLVRGSGSSYNNLLDISLDAGSADVADVIQGIPLEVPKRGPRIGIARASQPDYPETGGVELHGVYPSPKAYYFRGALLFQVVPHMCVSVQ